MRCVKKCVGIRRGTDMRAGDSQLKGADLRERSADHRPSVSRWGPERVRTVAIEFEVFALFRLTLENQG